MEIKNINITSAIIAIMQKKKKIQETNTGEDVEKRGLWDTISLNVNRCSHYRKYLVWRLCKKLKIELLYNPAIPLLDIF